MFDSSTDSDADFVPTALKKRKIRHFKPRINFNLLPNENLSRFRLKDEHVNLLVTQLQPLLKYDTDRNHALTVEQQIRLSLRILATGDSFQLIGDAHGVDKSTVSRTLYRFVDAVNLTVFPAVVDWPDSAVDVKLDAELFRQKGGMPSVFGCVDGTHINIIAPKIDEPQYVNRHGNHSINALVVCGPDLRFFYVSAKWPGSVNDARIFRNSSLSTRLESEWHPLPTGILLGDSGYANLDYLIMPLDYPKNRQEERFNRAHKCTRRLIECAIGVLKERFRCLLDKLYVDPIRACNIIRCCAALHNIVLNRKDIDEALLAIEEKNDDKEEPVEGSKQGQSRRLQLIKLFPNI